MNTLLDSYFKNLEHAHKSEILRVFDLIVSNNPQLSPDIKWNAPNFSKNGIDCVTFRLFPNDVFQIILHRGAKVKDAEDFEFLDAHKIIRWAAKDRGVIDVSKHLNKQKEIIETINSWVAIISP